MQTPQILTSHRSAPPQNWAAWASLVLAAILCCATIFGLARLSRPSDQLETVVAIAAVGGAVPLICAAYALTSRRWRFSQPGWPAKAALALLGVTLLMLIGFAAM